MKPCNAAKGVSGQDLCLSCGLCCNGVIFADGQLEAGDDAGRLRTLGLVFGRGGSRFVQPCAAHAECRCRIYQERPKYCRKFECLLLKRVQAGEKEPAEALRLIRKTLKQAETVKGLLRALGETDESLALSKRFRRVNQWLESGAVDPDQGELFGRLTLAAHALNLLLSGEFYPGAGG